MVLFVLFLGPLLGFGQDSGSTIQVTEAEAAQHRIGDRGPLYTNLRDGHSTVAFEVLVGTDGRVESVHTAQGFIGDLSILCKTWQYKPFERNGRPVVAKVKESVAILPIGERPQAHVPFPEIRDWNSLRITLSRGACYGTCPIYEIAIHGDGTVLYDGKDFVVTKGKQKAQIPHASLVTLVDAFRKADYFSLADGYVSGVTDNPTYVTSISFDGASKSVVDYVGQQVGMPPGVSDLEVAIDRLSGAYKWIGRK